MIDFELLFAVTGRVAFFALNGMVLSMIAVYVLGKARE